MGKILDTNSGLISMQPLPTKAEHLIAAQKVLVVDDEHHARKVIRTLLISIGVTHIIEASDGFEALDSIRVAPPDIVLLDWEMPGLDGPSFVRTVRSPETFPCPDLPIIMLTAHSERSRVIEAARLGVHDYLLKPVSIQALQSRILSLVAYPRRMVRRGSYYGPEPRQRSVILAGANADYDNVVMLY
jgi:two-component system, chemotaxis family, chemotaxis protein CheY